MINSVPMDYIVRVFDAITKCDFIGHEKWNN